MLRRDEDRFEIAVEDAVVTNWNSLFAVLVVLRDGVLHGGHRQVVVGWLGYLGDLMRDLLHHAVDVLELGQGAPAVVHVLPVEAWSEPYGERFREVFIGMFLRVPTEDVTDEIAREGIGTVSVAIRTRVRAEHLAPVGAIVEAICVVERVAGLVPKIPHRFVGALDRRGVVLLDSCQPRVGKVERDPDQGRAVRAAPLIAQVDRRPKIESLGRQLLVQLIDKLFEQRSADLQTKVGDSLRQQRVPFAFPIGGCLFHGVESGKGRTLLATVVMRRLKAATEDYLPGAFSGAAIGRGLARSLTTCSQPQAAPL